MSTPRKYPLAMEKCWLYAISSPADLARRLSTRHMQLSVDDLADLAEDVGNFRVFQSHKNGVSRAIQEPKPLLQKVHRRIHILLSRVETPDYLHSAVRGRSYLTNAQAHEASNPTIKIDVRKFFASVPRDTIRRFFVVTMKCRSDVAALLAKLLTYDGRLPTGSSASPIIAYYAFKPMFDEIAELGRSQDLTVTCYVDDIALTGAAANRALQYSVHQIVAKCGLRSHKMRIFAPGKPKVITGVCNTPTGQRVPNGLHLKIKRSFDAFETASTPHEKESSLRTLLGRLYAAGQIEPKFAERARTLRDSVKQSSKFADGESLSKATGNQ